MLTKHPQMKYKLTTDVNLQVEHVIPLRLDSTAAKTMTSYV